MTHGFKLRHTAHALLSLGTLSTVVLPVAIAADTALEEIVVTAERKEGNLQDAPVSIVALNADSLQQMGAAGLGDITNSVPNLKQITWSVGNSTLRFYVRGVGQTDSQLTADSPVGVYLDGVYVARTSGLAMAIPDLERIEVLRGPQGALYGRNTTGGAINLITRRPGDELAFSQTLRFGNYNSLRSTTVVDVPLHETLSTKFSYLIDKRDGTTENLGIGNDFNEFDNKVFRFDARWKPSDTVTVDYGFDDARYTATADLLHLDTVSSLFQGVLPEQKEHLEEALLPSPVRDSHTKGSGHAITVSVDTPLGEVKSISAYRELEFDAYQDQSANSFLNIFRNILLEDRQHQFSQELQLLGSINGEALSYVAGLYYFKESGEENAIDEIGIIGLETPRHLTAENKAYAAYTSWTWRPGGVSPWSYTLGGRFTKDERTANNFLIPEVEADYSKFTPSAVVDYRVSEDVSLYGKIATGYNAGGFNMRAANFGKDFGPESLTTFELGWKSELLARRLRVNGAVFYSDYKDIQFTIKVPDQPDPAFNETLNAGKSTIWGAELDVTALVTDNVLATLSYGFLDSDFKEVPLGDDPDRYHASNAPKNSVRASIDWQIAELPVGGLSLFADYSWQAESHTNPRLDPPGSDLIESYGLANAQLRLHNTTWKDNMDVSVALWVKNAFDKDYFVDAANVFQGLHANRLVRYGDPRTYGIELAVKF